MGEVNLEIGGRTYGIACDDGQEERVTDLGHYVNGRHKEITRAGAASSESHTHVLVALVLADEVFDLRQKIEEMTATGSFDPQEEAMIVRAIDHLTARIDTMTGRLEAA